MENLKQLRLKATKIATYIFVFIFAFVFSAYYLYSFLGLLNKFGFITDLNRLKYTFLVGLLFSLFVIVLVALRQKYPTKTKVGIWLSLNYPTLINVYCISSIIFYCIKTELVFDYCDVKEWIPIQWSIFGVSITIFLVWNVIIMKYLKGKQPKVSNNISLFQKYDLIDQKTLFYQDTLLSLSAITYLSINLFALIVATIGVYLYGDNYGIIIQNVAIISFLFCTNSLVLLFIDIVKLLNDEKKQMLKESKISCAQIKDKIEFEEKMKEMWAIVESINNLDSIDENQKALIKNELFTKIFGKDFFSIKGDDKKDDQL